MRSSGSGVDQRAAERIFVEPPLSFALLESLLPIGGGELEHAGAGPVGQQVEERHLLPAWQLQGAELRPGLRHDAPVPRAGRDPAGDLRQAHRRDGRRRPAAARHAGRARAGERSGRGPPLLADPALPVRRCCRGSCPRFSPMTWSPLARESELRRMAARGACWTTSTSASSRDSFTSATPPRRRPRRPSRSERRCRTRSWRLCREASRTRRARLRGARSLCSIGAARLWCLGECRTFSRGSPRVAPRL